MCQVIYIIVGSTNKFIKSVIHMSMVRKQEGWLLLGEERGEGTGEGCAGSSKCISEGGFLMREW